MKKIFLFICFAFLLIPSFSNAQSIIGSRENQRKQLIKGTSFPDYEPFSKASQDYHDKAYSIFTDAMKLFADEYGFEYELEIPDNYDQAVKLVRQGDIDLLLGSYYGTKRYSGLEFIYPAVLHNPIHVVMLPENIAQITSENDLKTKNGVYIQTEYFSDYMIQNFRNNDIKPIATPYEAYELLFTGKVDYIIGSYYFNYAYTLQTGLNPYVSFSKNSLWNMPLFISISKASKLSADLRTSLTRYLADKHFAQAVETSLENRMQVIEEQSRGTVPPKFVRAESLDEQTPADERPDLTQMQE